MKETFARNKVLSLLVLFLLLTNLLMLVFFVMAKPESSRPKSYREGRPDVMRILEKEVGFDEQQMTRYKSLKEQHWEKMKPYFGEMRAAKDSFYTLLELPAVADSTASRLADSIAAKQKQIDMQTFRHFQQVRALCTPEQQPRFDSLVNQVVRRMAGPWHRDKDKGPRPDSAR
ncbi:Spy/CpxP family protein refolding chaperone [Chitinophaga lutea]